MKPDPIIRRAPLFNVPFWVLLHTVLLTINVLFSALFFPSSQLSFWLALLNATAQVSFLGLCLLLAWEGAIGRRLRRPAAGTLFYMALGFLAALYVCEFFYFRIMGTSLILFFKYLWRFPLRDVSDLVMAAQISTTNLLGLGAFILLLPATLWAIARVTTRWSRRRAWRLSFSMISAAALLSLGLAAASQWLILNRGNLYHWELYAKALPVYLPIVATGGQTVTLAARVRPYEPLDRKAAALPINADQLPQDLSLFIIVSETIRQDFVLPAVTPHLHAFEQENLSFRHGFCSGNSTHYSWFSIFFGAYPIYWNAQRTGAGQLGSPALQVLKRAGFRIHLYTKPQHLPYLGFGRVIFGENHRLVDEAVIAPRLSTHDADQYSVDRLKEQIRRGLPSGRHLYLLFLDSTHHNYFFPENDPIPFTPYIDDFSYLKWNYSQGDVERIRNRYKNALHYLDSLFGQLVGTLKETGAYSTSWIGFVADHGEEFMEHGALIHGSNLFDPQMRVPIYFRKPGKGARQLDRTIAGIDFFPTLLDLLGLYDQSRSLFQGRSALSDGAPHAAVLANNNGAGDPFDFVLCNGRGKLHFLLDRQDPRASRQVTFTGGYDGQDRPIPFGGRGGASLAVHIRDHFREALWEIPFLAFDDPL